MSIELDRWVVSQRGPRNVLDPWRPYAFFNETEPGPDGNPVDIATVFLTNRECPFRCVMCDLWRNTLTATVPLGAIPAQIDYALGQLPTARWLKLYNAGSFFDPRAIPEADYESIAGLTHAPYASESDRCDSRAGLTPSPSPAGEGSAIHPDGYGLPSPRGRGAGGEARASQRPSAFPHSLSGSGEQPLGTQRCRGFERVIVECHPAFVGERALRFRDLLGDARLEVALGLETAHPEVLQRLNKRMTLPQFRQAAQYLRAEGIDVRAFILVRPPWLTEAEGLEWARRSLDFAFETGVQTCVLIPTRDGNGAMEALGGRGEYAPPSLRTLEKALEYGLSLRAGRVFVDLWDVDRFRRCGCDGRRIERLRAMNGTQALLPEEKCVECGLA